MNTGRIATLSFIFFFLLSLLAPILHKDFLVSAFTVSRIDEPDDDEDFEEDDLYWGIDDEWEEDDWREGEEDFDEDWLAETVVESGTVDPAWAEKPVGEPFRELLYESYTTFIIEVDGFRNDQFGPPEISVAGGKPSSPDAEDSENSIMRAELRGDAIYGNFGEAGSETFSLRVDYYCKKPGTSRIGVFFTVISGNSEVKNISFFWEKECGSGNRLGFSISQGNELVVQDGSVTERWSTPKHKEPLGVVSTIFYFKIAKNMGSQDYSNP